MIKCGQPFNLASRPKILESEMSYSLVLGGREEDCYHHQSDPSSFGSASHFWHPHIAKWDLEQKISNIIIIFPEKLGWSLCNDVIQKTCNIVTNLSISVWYGWRCEGNAPNIFCDWAVRLQMLVWLKMSGLYQYLGHEAITLRLRHRSHGFLMINTATATGSWFHCLGH